MEGRSQREAPLEATSCIDETPMHERRDRTRDIGIVASLPGLTAEEQEAACTADCFPNILFKICSWVMAEFLAGCAAYAHAIYAIPPVDEVPECPQAAPKQIHE
jgi:hypothetical protein